MPGSQDVLDIIGPQSEVQAQIDFVIGGLTKVDETIRKITPLASVLGNGTSSNFRQQAGEMAQAMQQIANMQQKIIGLETELQQVQAKGYGPRKAKTDEELRAMVAANLERQKTVAAVKDELRLAEAQNGSINQRKILLKQLQAEYDKLGTSAENADKRSQLLSQIQPLDASLKSELGGTGRHQMKVGDYTGALQVLEGQLNEVTAQMKTMASAGQQDSAMYAKLAEEAALLNTIVQQQEAGFSSVTMQIRASERALQTMRAAGMETSEAFNQLREVTVEAAQAQKEFQRQQKLLEGEAPLLGALTLAAKGLAGAYAVGQGSIALFAEGNEKVEKELNKLVAILTILQGLREAYELIQQAGAVRLAIETTLTNAAVAVQTKFAGATQASAAAQTELAAAEGAVTVGAEAEIGALGETAVAAEGATAAIAETEVATTALSTTLIATGIGAAIVAIAASIAYLLSKIPDWIKGNELTIKQQGELAEAIKKANEAMIEQADFAEKLDQSSIKYYKNQLALSQAAGQNEEKRFANRKALNEAERESAQESIDALGADNEQQGRLAGTIDMLNIRRREALRIQTEMLNIPDQNKTTDQKEQQEAAAKNVEFYSKQIDSIKSLYEAGQKAREKHAETDQEAGRLELEQAKFNEEERQKVILEGIKIRADYQKKVNSDILSDDRSTQAQRLAALKSNAAAEQDIIQGELNHTRTDPAKSEAEKVIAERDAAEKIKEVRLELAKETEAVNKQYRERERQAQLELATEALNAEIKANDAILTEDKAQEQESLKDFDGYLKKRSEALASSYELRRGIIRANELKELADAAENGKTQSEIFAIQLKYNEQLADEDIAQAKRVTDEEKKQLDLRLQNVEKEFQAEKRVVDKKAADQISSTDNKYTAGSIGQIRRERDIATAEFNKQKAELEAQERAIFKRQEEASKAGNQDALNSANSDKANNDIAKAELAANRKRQLNDQAIEEAKLYGDVVIQTTDLVKEAVDARYENELNYIQRLIERNNELKGEETDRIRTSTLNEQEKAAAIARIDAQTSARNRLLAHEEAEIKHKQAVSDKAFNVAEAIEKGVIAVISALPKGPEYAAIVAASAAIEVAKIAATPIPPVPAYEKGKDFHPGGPMIVGEKGPELMIAPDGKMSLTPGVPTLMYGERGTKIIPNNKLFANSDMVNNVLLAQIFKQSAAQIESNETAAKMEELKTAIESAARAQISAIRKVSVRTIVNVDTKFPTYIEKRIKG